MLFLPHLHLKQGWILLEMKEYHNCKCSIMGPVLLWDFPKQIHPAIRFTPCISHKKQLSPSALLQSNRYRQIFSWFFCFFLSYPRSNVGVLCFLLRFEIQSSILWQNLNGTFAIFGVENWSLEWLREGNWSLGISFLLTCPFPPFKNLSNLVGNKTVVLIRWLFQLFNLKIPAVFLRRVGMGLLWDYWQANLAVFWNGLSLCCL